MNSSVQEFTRPKSPIDLKKCLADGDSTPSSRGGDGDKDLSLTTKNTIPTTEKENIKRPKPYF